jgi:hypothetical protein
VQVRLEVEVEEVHQVEVHSEEAEEAVRLEVEDHLEEQFFLEWGWREPDGCLSGVSRGHRRERSPDGTGKKKGKG